MFEHFNFKQLEGLEAEQARCIVSGAKKEAYQSVSFWIKSALAFFLALVFAVFLMQLPRLLNIDKTIIGMLLQASGTLFGIIVYQYFVKKIFLKYLVNKINEA